MSTLRRVLLAIVILEIVAVAFPLVRKLGSTRVPLPALEKYHDSATISDLKQLAGRFPYDSLEKWTTLANAYLAYGHYAQADACLGAAQAIEPSSAEIALQRGLCFERLGQLDPAQTQFQLAAERSRGVLASRAWYHLGRLALRAEDSDSALRSFEKAGDTHWASVYQRAKLLIRGSDPAAGEKLLQLLSGQHPDDLHVWLLRSQALRAQGREREAIDANDRAQRAISTLVLDDTEYYLRPIRRQFGVVREFAAAREGLKGGTTREPAVGLATRLLADPLWLNCYLNVNQDAAELAQQAGHFTLARDLLKRQREQQYYSSAKSFELWGDQAISESQPLEAISNWKHALAIDPHRTSVHAKLARLAEKLHDRQTAADALRMAKFYSALELFRQNEIRDAGPSFGELAAEPEASAAMWFYLGECERLRGDTAAARAAYLQCLERDADFERARTALNRLVR